MSFALENKHKQSRENREKTNNNLGKAKKTKKKQFWGSLEEKGVQPRVSENCFFCFFWFSQGFFGFLVFLILGGPAKSLPELFFFVFCFLKAFLVLFWFLSFMHIYQCFLVLIVALMHLPNIYENLWKTKTQAPWPPLLLKNECRCGCSFFFL